MRSISNGANSGASKSPVHVEPLVFDLLVYLVENRDRVVSKDHLIASVWGGRIVSNSTLTSRVDAARKTVGDSGEDQRLIRTIARRGLRFVAGVRIQSNDEPAHATGPETDFRSSSLNRRLRFPRLWCVLRHVWLPHCRILLRPAGSLECRLDWSLESIGRNALSRRFRKGC